MNPERHFLFYDILGQIKMITEVIWTNSLAFVLYFGIIEAVYQNGMNRHTFEIKAPIIESKR